MYLYERLVGEGSVCGKILVCGLVTLTCCLESGVYGHPLEVLDAT